MERIFSIARSTIVTFLLLFLFLWSAEAQEEEDDKNIFDKGGISLKMRKARNQLMQNDRRGAMNTAREILAKYEGHAKANFLIAKAHYQLGHYDLADEYVRKAESGKEKIGAEFHLMFGKVHHRAARLDSAIRMFEAYKDKMEAKTLPKKKRIRVSNVDRYIDQCEFAKKMMKDPVDVERENLGRRFNSRYDEYAPCATRDGKKIFFTARRSDTKGGGIDHKGDHRYFEDIYYCEWDEEEEEWTRPKSVPGRVNTEAHDAIVSLAPNGERMYVYRNNPEHAGDIFRSKKSDRTGKWRRPKLLPEPINSSYYEASISTTRDEEKAFFISERKGGFGRGDIYVTRKKGYNEWSEPKNLGNTINTERDEKFVHVRPDGKKLFFASNGHPGLGSYDIYVTEKVDGEWTEPKNLGYPINTVNEESTFSFLSKKNTMFMAGIYDVNYGGRDIYRVDLKEMDLFSGEEKKSESTQ